ncbi:MAG: 50S ribosomal protein P1 [Candidatus Lokiarchaeota archaeon]|nr:50S ribosomal protein P1 [Candidatus Lokiarchaeota archaeon]MBD3341438.1 50S ribosomal protein P1 [Candidatus Lokiarchaeota archaeon]
MESVYAALLLHKAQKDITEAALEKILKAAGVTPDASQLKKLVAGLKDTDIDTILSSAAAAPMVAAPTAGGGGGAAPAEEEDEEEEEEDEEPAGIGSLF